MDDDEMGRQPRHERARKTSQPKRVAGLAEASEAFRPCLECGDPVAIPLPETMPEGTLEALRMIAQRQLDGELEVRCAGCEKRRSDEEERVEREARLAAAVESRREAAGLPPKWKRQRFEHLDADGERGKAIELAWAWGAGEIDGLVLYGPVGRGKTAIAAAAANLRVEQRPVRWLPVAELLTDLHGPFDSPERARATRKLDAGRGRAALVLDDLDKLKPSEWAVQPLYVAINAWIEAELPLLVTLNRPLGQLREWLPETFAEPIASRLAGYCRQREVAGADRRLTA